MRVPFVILLSIVSVALTAASSDAFGRRKCKTSNQPVATNVSSNKFCTQYCCGWYYDRDGNRVCTRYCSDCDDWFSQSCPESTGVIEVLKKYCVECYYFDANGREVVAHRYDVKAINAGAALSYIALRSCPGPSYYVRVFEGGC